MKTLILALLLATPALAQKQWQSPDTMLVTSPRPTAKPEARARMLKTQAAAARHLGLPANCIVLLATLDCSDCRRPLEQLRSRKDAVVIIRARTANVERWKHMKPTAARVIAIDGDEADKDWFDLGAIAMPTVIKWENGRAVGVADHVLEN